MILGQRRWKYEVRVANDDDSVDDNDNKYNNGDGLCSKKKLRPDTADGT